MIKCSEACTPCCDFCIYTVHEIFEDEELGGTIYGGPIHCELHPDEKHDIICESGGFCDDFHCFRAEKTKERAEHRRRDWQHAKNKKNKSYYYCKDHPWYDNLHQYSKNKVHCSCGMCARYRKTNNHGRKRKIHGNYAKSKNWSVNDRRRLEEMEDQILDNE